MVYSGIINSAVIVETIALIGLIISAYFIYRAYKLSDNLKPALMKIEIGFIFGIFLAALYFFAPNLAPREYGEIFVIIETLLLLATSIFMLSGFYQMTRILSNKKAKKINPDITLRNFPIRGVAIATITAGMIVLAGWIFDIPYLRSIIVGLPTMKIITAAIFILIGSFLYVQSKSIGRRNLLGTPLAISIIVIAFVAIATMIWLILSGKQGSYNIFLLPNTITLISFLLLGISALLIRKNKKYYLKIVTVFALLTIAISVLVQLISLFFPAVSYPWSNISGGMAIHTSILFILDGLAFIALTKINGSR